MFQSNRYMTSFSDAQEQASALAGWNQDYLQLTAGSFHGEVTTVQGHGIKLFVEKVGQSVFQNGCLPEGVLAVGIPLDASGSGVFCGRSCDANAFHVFSGASGFEFRTSRQHTMLGLELRLPEVVDSDCGLKSATVLALNPVAHTALRNWLLTLYQSAVAQPALLLDRAIAGTVADFLLDQISVHAHDARDMTVHARTHTQWKLVQRSMTLVNAAPDTAPTVADLCCRLGVSRRTLQNAFAGVLNVSPLTWLKAVRLHRARGLLKNARSVTDAATACGFWHFGHFAHDYYALFGERPSQTSCVNVKANGNNEPRMERKE